MWTYFERLRTKLLLTTFHDFCHVISEKNVKSHVFLKSEKNVKYVFTSTGPGTLAVAKTSPCSGTPTQVHAKVVSRTPVAEHYRVHGSVQDICPPWISTPGHNHNPGLTWLTWLEWLPRRQWRSPCAAAARLTNSAPLSGSARCKFRALTHYYISACRVQS